MGWVQTLAGRNTYWVVRRRDPSRYLEPARFGPAVFDLQELEIRHKGHIWDRLDADAYDELVTKGKLLFQSHGL